MQGKPLNMTRAAHTKVTAHPLFGPLATAIGAGIEAQSEPRRSRYERILVLTEDRDVPAGRLHPVATRTSATRMSVCAA